MTTSLATKPTQRQTEYAMPGLIWVIEVEWKRKKDKPVEALAVTSGGMLQALLLAKEIATQLKVPQSWVNPVLYRKCRDKKEQA
jgi:hypothetical protein